MKIQIKNRWTGEVLFEYEKEENNLRTTVLEAVSRSAYLEGADLRGAYLRGADLRGAYLEGADLRGADLRGAVNADLTIAQTRILPEGDLIGYKKTLDDKGRRAIVKLLIPKEAKRSSAFGRKCRAEYAIVLELPEGLTETRSDYNSSFKYRVGETVRPEYPFDENWQEECASGIHFFITRIEAENY